MNCLHWLCRFQKHGLILELRQVFSRDCGVHSNVTKGGGGGGGNCLLCKIVHKSYIFRVSLKAYQINQVTEEKVFDFFDVTVCKLYERRFPPVKVIWWWSPLPRCGELSMLFCCGFI